MIEQFEREIEELAEAYFHNDRERMYAVFAASDKKAAELILGREVEDKSEALDEFTDEQYDEFASLTFMIEDEAIRRANARDGLATPAII